MPKKRDGAQKALDAIHHPIRREILEAMISAGSPISPRVLSSEMKRPLSSVSYHVRILLGCDAVSLKFTRPVRGSAEHFYAPSPEFVSRPGIAEFLRRRPSTT